MEQDRSPAVVGLDELTGELFDVGEVSTREEFVAELRQTWRAHHRSLWELGDKWNARSVRYGPGREIAAEAGVPYQTLQNCGSVSKSFEIYRRREILPWAIHAELAALPPAEADYWLDLVEEHGWARSELRKQLAVTAVTELPPIPEGRFQVIEADPPWDVPSGPKGPGYQYQLMPTDQIRELRGIIDQLAHDDAHLYLWATNTMLPDAVQVMDAWGFQHRTVLTWVKPQIGLGHYFRTSTEHVLFGTRGKLDTLVNDQRTHFEMPAGRHSAKPAEFYDLIERCSPGPYVRLFARDQRPGWTSWGAEA